MSRYSPTEHHWSGSAKVLGAGISQRWLVIEWKDEGNRRVSWVKLDTGYELPQLPRELRE